MSKNLLGLWACLCLSHSVLGAENVYATAQRQEAEEQQRRSSARIGALEEALQAYQHEITTLKAEMRGLREELARANNRSENAATQDAIKQLASSIQEVDRKRMADNEKVLRELRNLGRSVTTPPVDKRPVRTPTPPASGGNSGSSNSGSTENQYEYTIRDGDTLVEIVKGLRELGVNVTQEQIEKANPNVKWNKMVIGKKIIIPAPAPR